MSCVCGISNFFKDYLSGVRSGSARMTTGKKSTSIPGVYTSVSFFPQHTLLTF